MLTTSTWLAKSLLFAGVAFSTCDALAIPSTADRISVQTAQLGSVTGYSGLSGNRFVVPYASPPTGALRWKDPQAIRRVRSYDATQLPPVCPQLDRSGQLVPGNEDCLYATVYTPKGVTSTSNLPVMFWVHGGSFYTGATTSFGLLDAAALATKQQMVIVEVQCRLGLLGFMRNDALGLTGNYGLKDVIMALGFVKSEIAAFGGDPSRVTIAGQSSGAELIKTLLVTPSATSLFARSILQSAPLDFSDHSITLANMVGNLAAQGISCSAASCLSSLSVTDILASEQMVVAAGIGGQLSPLTPSQSFMRPVVDGSLVPRDFKEVVASGGTLEGNKEIMFSTMAREGAQGASQVSPVPLPPSTFPIYAKFFFPGRAERILSSPEYAFEKYSANDAVRDAFTQIATDFSWVCANQQTALNLTAHGQKTFLAEFDMGISYSNNSIAYNGNNTHEDDILAVFSGSRHALAPRRMISEVQARWTAFVKSGSPNDATFSGWAPVRAVDKLNLLRIGNLSSGFSSFADIQRPEICTVGSGLYTSVPV